jgi:hypothetical protein
MLSTLSTDQKGAVAELAIAHAAAGLGIDVYRPLCEGGRYDLILDLNDRLSRVQCKWAPLHGDVVVVRCYSLRRTRNGLVRRVYRDGEIDAFAAYCEQLDACYYLPYELFPGRTQIQLRVGPCRNNQQRLVNWAQEFDFAATLRPLAGP